MVSDDGHSDEEELLEELADETEAVREDIRDLTIEMRKWAEETEARLSRLEEESEESDP